MIIQLHRMSLKILTRIIVQTILHKHTGRVATSMCRLDLFSDFCRCGSFCSKNDYVFDRQSQPCQIKFTPSICKVESDPGNGLWWHLDCVRVVCMMNVRDENCVYKIGFSCVVAL